MYSGVFFQVYVLAMSNQTKEILLNFDNFNQFFWTFGHFPFFLNFKGLWSFLKLLCGLMGKFWQH